MESRCGFGDTWTGPHAGIPYELAATGNDIYYRTFPRPNVEKRVKLSAEKGKSGAEQIARMLSAFKGSGGGRFYVNEFCSVFSPINGTGGLQYLYIGQIELDSWFPDPMAAAVSAVMKKASRAATEMACPGVVVNCPSVLECRDAVACSEVPAFRYELALGPAEQQTAEHGTSVHCL